MNVETQLHLEEFQLRPYQAPIWEAYRKGYKRILAVLPRRSGKDFSTWNLIIRIAMDRVGIYWFVYPTYAQGKKILWDGMTNEGKRFLDYLPEETVDSMNSQEMKIRLRNGSIIQVLGSDNPDSLVGTNPSGIVFSEYSLQNPIVYQLVRPILTANDGFAIFLSTPRGKNHLWELWNIAQSNKSQWFSYRMTVLETGHIPLSKIQQELDSGEMTDDLIQQEYYCSFDRGVEGAYYSKYLQTAVVDGRIGIIPWEPGLQTHVAMDIGVNDATTLLWFQVTSSGSVVRIIDCYSNHSLGVDHYIKVMQDKPYSYGKFFAPFDIKVREFGAGALTRYEQARQLGITFTVLEQIGLQEGVNNVYMNFRKLWIDHVKCRSLINALENYRREWDEQKQRHKDQPIRNWATHYADALRYLCQSLPKATTLGLTAEELDKRYLQARYGNDMINLPSLFRQR